MEFQVRLSCIIPPTTDTIFVLWEGEFDMAHEKTEVAKLSKEQLAELNILEGKLGVTLVAYENKSGSTDKAFNQR